MGFRTGLECTNESLYFTLQGKSIIKFDREAAQRFHDRLKRWADGYTLTDGTIMGLQGFTKFVSTDKFLTIIYNNIPVLRLDRDQCARFCGRIQAWIDEPKMKPIDKIIREIRAQEREMMKNGIHMDPANSG
jgi:hypothetical protein